MSSALSTALTGLQASQTILDVAANNLANSNTIGFKTSSVSFSDTYSNMISSASSPTDTIGGTNPVQVGTGCSVSTIATDMSQGNISSTGNSLDVAIEGDGFFVVNDGEQNVYTRAGSFTIDADGMLVDSTTGYPVQRVGTTGEDEHFQTTGDNNIYISYDDMIPAQETTGITLDGNLSTLADPIQNIVDSNLAYTTSSGTPASSSTLFSDLDQFSVSPPTFGTTSDPQITITGLIDGTDPGDPTTAVNYTFTITDPDTATMQDILDEISSQFPESTAYLDSEGQVSLRSDTTGYTEEMLLSMTYTPSTGTEATDSLETPTEFELTSVGGNSYQNVETAIYNSAGEEIYLSGILVESDQTNTWDMVIQSLETESGTSLLDSQYRISGIEFDNTGSYIGVEDAGDLTFQLSDNGTGTSQSLTFDVSSLNQYSTSDSTTITCEQNGYQSGSLTDVTIDSTTGNIVGSYSNGQSFDLATLAIATFNNPGGLESIGSGYYCESVNSGDAQISATGVGNAGTLVSESLESSNVDTTVEYINMIEAQNAYQANAKTIQIDQEMMDVMLNLIR